MDKIKELLKDQKAIISGVAGLAGIVTLISAIIGFFSETKSIAGLIVMLIASLAIVGGVVVYNLYNKKYGFLTIFLGSVIGLLAFRIAGNATGNGLLIVWLVCVLHELLATIGLFMRIEKVEEKDLIKRLNILQLLLAVITFVFVVFLLVYLASTKGTVSIITCVIVLLVLIASKVLTIVFQIPEASFLMVLVPLLTIMGMVPREFVGNDNAAVTLTVLYILTLVLPMAEFVLNKKQFIEESEEVAQEEVEVPAQEETPEE